MKKLPDIPDEGVYFIHEHEGHYVALTVIFGGFKVIVGRTQHIHSSHDRFYCLDDGTSVHMFYTALCLYIEKGYDIMNLPIGNTDENHGYLFPDIIMLMGSGDILEGPASVINPGDIPLLDIQNQEKARLMAQIKAANNPEKPEI